MTGSQGESQSRGSLAARPGKDKIEEVAKNVEEILKTFRPSWRYDLQYLFCWKTNTPNKSFHCLVLQPKYQQVPEQSTEPSRTDEASFAQILTCVHFTVDQKNILPFLFSGV